VAAHFLIHCRDREGEFLVVQPVGADFPEYPGFKAERFERFETLEDALAEYDRLVRQRPELARKG
jgi:hypothetical protein